jgi:hypothetical protein
MLGKPILNPRHQIRAAARNPEFSAGVIFDFDETRTVNCLIRDASLEGAQLRIAQDSAVAPGSWLLNLRTCMGFELVPIWRRPSRMGVIFARARAIDDTLPPDLERLKTALAQAKLNFSLRVAATGVCTRDQQERLAVSYSSWGMI